MRFFSVTRREISERGSNTLTSDLKNRFSHSRTIRILTFLVGVYFLYFGSRGAVHPGEFGSFIEGFGFPRSRLFDYLVVILPPLWLMVGLALLTGLVETTALFLASSILFVSLVGHGVATLQGTSGVCKCLGSLFGDGAQISYFDTVRPENSSAFVFGLMRLSSRSDGGGRRGVEWRSRCPSRRRERSFSRAHPSPTIDERGSDCRGRSNSLRRGRDDFRLR